jgi:hypothetical protein
MPPLYFKLKSVVSNPILHCILSMKTPFQASPDSKRAKTGHDDGGKDDARNALLAECHEKLEEIGAHYTSTHFFLTALPYFLMVVEYAQWCLRQMMPGEVYIILQGKCPVSMKTADGMSISLALGGNCPKEKRWSICTVRCADQLFGNLLKRFFFFNCRVQCCKDTKTGRCAVCSPWEAEALGRIYEVLCMYALESEQSCGTSLLPDQVRELSGRYITGT